MGLAMVCWLGPVCAVLGTAVGPIGNATSDSNAELRYKSRPNLVTVARIAPNVDSCSISDVEVADFDNDGLNDVAVAWYTTVNNDIDANQRYLTIYFNNGTELVRSLDINLYIPDYENEPKSIFRIGTGDIGVGDFDGDGDQDLAVAPFFGDEIWFLENLGYHDFDAHLKFLNGWNTSGNFLTPPVMLAADFDGDGRDELVYVVDPVVHLSSRHIHFWQTFDEIANIQRVDWIGSYGGSVYTVYTRTLGVHDFDGDQRPDLCYTGAINPPNEDGPILTFWYGLDTARRQFAVRNEYPTMLCSDLVPIQVADSNVPGVILTDLHGSRMEYWERDDDSMEFELVAAVDGFAALAYERGMTAALGDVDGDGDLDVVTRQKVGGTGDRNQVEIVLQEDDGEEWTLVSPTPLDTLRLADDPNNPILRPRNLAVADLFGNRLPEVVAGFGPNPVDETDAPPGCAGTLDIAIWQNSCVGDVNRDGRTDAGDLGAVHNAFGSSPGWPGYDADADLNRDSVVDNDDLWIVLNDFGCSCWDCIQLTPADTNCDGAFNACDVDGFVAALGGEDFYYEQYPLCQWLNADCNGDHEVNWYDVNPFVTVLSAQLVGGEQK